MKMNPDKVRFVTKTGTLIALLIAVQWLTDLTRPFAGQYITESCVNCILVVSVLIGGLWCGAAVAAISPFCAFVLGIGPQLLQIIPAIAMGNLTMVLIAYAMLGTRNPKLLQKITAVAAMALLKFLVLYVAVIKVMVPVMGPSLPAKEEAVYTGIFCWPQLVTALIGGALALLLVPLLKKR